MVTCHDFPEVTQGCRVQTRRGRLGYVIERNLHYALIEWDDGRLGAVGWAAFKDCERLLPQVYKVFDQLRFLDTEGVVTWRSLR